MKQAPVISTQPPEQPGMDYALLRREAISYIEELGGDYWTDYNTHDPGITILEALCYAITDLSYRLNYDIRDILAEPPDGDNGRRQFFTARDILAVNPVTIGDYRRLIIDVDGVKNAWLETTEGPYGAKGYYNVYIEPEDETTNDNDALAKKVRARLLARRNLCEDFIKITVLSLENIKVDADVSIEEGADATAILRGIYLRLADFISPPVPLLPLDEMLSRHYRAAEIFNGPPLEHGFIDIKDLQAAKRKTQLHASDLIYLIQNIPGVKAVGSLMMSGAAAKWHSWALDITPGYTPRLGEGSSIRLFKDNIPCHFDEQRLEEYLLSTGKQTHKTTGKQAADLIMPSGTYRNLDDYETIQNELPLSYGVGHFGLPEDITQRRKAQANQLRGYLTLFDQILANYLSQLEHVKGLFSPYGYTEVSYFSNVLPEDIESRTSRKSGPNAKEETYIVKLWKSNSEDLSDVLEPLATARKRRGVLGRELQEMVEEPQVARERNNRLLNHLLARFAEEFTDVSLLYRRSDISEEYLAAKREFLQKYPLLSAGRARAFDYSVKSPVWDSENVSGLEQRIALKLGIRDFKRRRLSGTEKEGFHFIEHILLLPVSGEEPRDSANRRDDYSFRVSFVFPDWAGRFQDKAFQRFTEGIIQSEIPAHLNARIHWRNQEYIKEFEKWYEIWQQQKSAESAKATEAAGKLIKLLSIGGEEKSSRT